jgi:hypothetical protein
VNLGIVVGNLGDGDASYAFVDEERWEQIVGLPDTLPNDDLIECIAWLTMPPDPEVQRPRGAPEPRGTLLKRVFTQTFSPEAVGLEGHIIGILTIP